MSDDKLKAFVKENSTDILEYINSEILKDIGVLSSEFFDSLVDEYFAKEDRSVSVEDLTLDDLPYHIFVELLNQRHAFTFFRKETMTLDVLYKDVRVYYNYVKFTIEDGFFCIYLVQTKAGVTAFENEIIKFSKKFPMKTSGMIEHIVSKK